MLMTKNRPTGRGAGFDNLTMVWDGAGGSVHPFAVGQRIGPGFDNLNITAIGAVNGVLPRQVNLTRCVLPHLGKFPAIGCRGEEDAREILRRFLAQKAIAPVGDPLGRRYRKLKGTKRDRCGQNRF